LLFPLFLWLNLFPEPVLAQDSIPMVRVSVAQGTKSINQVLDEITLQTGFLFTYNADLIKGGEIVKFGGKDLLLRDALDSLLHNPRLGYRFIDRNIVIFQRNAAPPSPLLLEIDRSLIQGRTVDGPSGKPLAYATIALFGTSLGSITNQDGEFSFKIPGSIPDPILVVSYMGYKRQYIPVEYPIHERLEIALERETIPLQEVIIRFSDPVLLVEEALKRIPENYLNDYSTMTAFYRESVKRNEHCMIYTEAVLDVSKSPYATPLTTDAVRIRKGRKITDVTSEDTIMVKLRSGISTSLDLDVVKNRPDFLSPDFLERYDLEFTDLMAYGDRLVYVISFQQKSSIPDLLFKGRLYLDQERLVLLAADFEFNPELIQKEPGFFLVSKSPSIRIKPVKAAYHVDYRDLEGRYYISQVRAEVELKVRKKRKWVGARYLISIEMAITDVIPGQRLRIDPSERVRPNVVLADEPFEFDPLFWGIYNTIEPEASLMESIQRLKENLLQINH
jgi:hypothetical protein